MKKIIIGCITMLIVTTSVVCDVVKYDKPKAGTNPISKPNHPLGNK